jgi:hypothetical protein
MMVIRTFLNNVDAELAKSALEAAEITAEIRADDCGGIRPPPWAEGVALLVDDEDAAEAADVLSTIFEADPGVAVDDSDA